MKNYWTKREDEILRNFWKGSRPLDEATTVLPGRSLYAIKHHAQKLNCANRKPGQRPQIETNVAAMIKKHGPISSAEMARMLLCRPQQVDQYVRRLHRANKIHVGNYVELTENYLTRLWVHGKGIDAKKPLKSEREPWHAVEPPKPTFRADPLMAALYAIAA